MKIRFSATTALVPRVPSKFASQAERCTSKTATSLIITQAGQRHPPKQEPLPPPRLGIRHVQGRLGEDQRLQACRAAVAVEESLLELASGRPAAWLDFAALHQPDLREAHHHSAEQAQDKGRRRVADPAVIFAQADVQRVVQAALDDPIAPFEFEKAGRV